MGTTGELVRLSRACRHGGSAQAVVESQFTIHASRSTRVCVRKGGRRGLKDKGLDMDGKAATGCSACDNVAQAWRAADSDKD